MKPLAMQSATGQELHDLHDQLTQPNPQTGKRLESGVAVFIALALVLDQRLEEICKAVKAIQPVKVELMPPTPLKPSPPKSRRR